MDFFTVTSTMVGKATITLLISFVLSQMAQFLCVSIMYLVKLMIAWLLLGQHQHKVVTHLWRDGVEVCNWFDILHCQVSFPHKIFSILLNYGKLLTHLQGTGSGLGNQERGKVHASDCRMGNTCISDFISLVERYSSLWKVWRKKMNCHLASVFLLTS